MVNNAPGATTLATSGSTTLRGTTSGAVNVTAGETAPTGAGANTAGNWAISVGNLTAGSASLTTKNGTGNAATDGISGDITQQAGTTLRTEGAFSATTYGANVTLANSGNNFGALTLASAGADIALTESSTLNIAAVNAGANKQITLVSENGSIIQTAAGTGITGGAGAAAAISLTAAKGNITLNGTNEIGRAHV